MMYSIFCLYSVVVVLLRCPALSIKQLLRNILELPESASSIDGIERLYLRHDEISESCGRRTFAADACS